MQAAGQVRSVESLIFVFVMGMSCLPLSHSPFPPAPFALFNPHIQT